MSSAGRNTFNIDLHRESIDAFKASRLCNPYKRHAYDTITREGCVRLWIEQIGDAELYEQRWHELEAIRLDQEQATLRSREVGPSGPEVS